METLQIKFQPSFKEKLMAFLNSYDSNEVEIVQEKSSFETTKNRVQESYRKLLNNETKIFDIDELDAFLNATISEYEN
jgi:cellobiose phosphorylase